MFGDRDEWDVEYRARNPSGDGERRDGTFRISKNHYREIVIRVVFQHVVEPTAVSRVSEYTMSLQFSSARAQAIVDLSTIAEYRGSAHHRESGRTYNAPLIQRTLPGNEVGDSRAEAASGKRRVPRHGF